jgi:hypothetical protein
MMKIRDKVTDYKMPIIGGILGYLVTLIPYSNSINPLLPIILYRLLIIYPILFLPIMIFAIDLNVYGNKLRGIFLGFSIATLTFGFESYYDVFRLGNYDFRMGENMQAIFRSFYLSGILAIYERLIAYLQNQPSKKEKK